MNSEARKILIIEDDKDISNLVKINLEDEGYLVTCSHDGCDGLQQAVSGDFVLVILDIVLPGISGVEICKQLSESNPEIIVLMLTSRDSEVDKIIGLELGADEYLTKPFSVRELTSRIRSLFRRLERTSKNQCETDLVQINELVIDPNRRQVSLASSPIDLTAKEYELLYFLARNAGRPFTREQILTYVWNYSYEGYEKTVTSHINRLRTKIEKDPSNPRYIITVRGVGYRFAEYGE